MSDIGDLQAQYYVANSLDDATFMLFDLERGGFIEQDGEFMLTDTFKVNYKRVRISETLVENAVQIVSDFFISIYYNNNEAIKFETRGELRKFTIFSFDGFVCEMFLNSLESFRKEKFHINS